jgi:hypothetical protein
MRFFTLVGLLIASPSFAYPFGPAPKCAAESRLECSAGTVVKGHPPAAPEIVFKIDLCGRTEIITFSDGTGARLEPKETPEGPALVPVQSTGKSGFWVKYVSQRPDGDDPLRGVDVPIFVSMHEPAAAGKPARDLAGRCRKILCVNRFDCR